MKNKLLPYSAQIEPVIGTDVKSLNDLETFYRNVYLDCFTNKDERESLNNLFFYLKRSTKTRLWKYHIILIKDNTGSILGGAIFDYFKKSNTGMVEFVAIRNDYQHLGLGSFLYRAILRYLIADARQNHLTKPAYVFCEVEIPATRGRYKKNILFWNHHRFRHLNFQYIQPNLSPGQKALNNLWLMMRGTDTSVPGQLILNVLSDYLKYGMNIPKPTQNPHYRKMRQEITRMGNVSTSTLSESTRPSGKHRLTSKNTQS